MLCLLCNIVCLPISILLSIFWATLDVIYFLFPFLVIFCIVKIVIGESDLVLQFCEKLGKKPECLRGQVVWITGASSGIGEALAYRLARAGCKLILSARREDELNRVRNACIALSGKILDDDIYVLPLDLLNFNEHKEYVEKVLNRFNKIDILVNNAARGQVAKIKETPIEIDREMTDLAVLAQISITKAVLPHWIERKNGYVVVTSSGAGKMGLPFGASYSMGKHALQGFFEAFRLEHAGDNIEVTLICPGPILTNIRQHSFTPISGQEFGEELKPDKKWMPAEKCADLMAIAMANKLGEVWISRQPVLTFYYLAQYLPDIYKWFAKKFGMKARGNYEATKGVQDKIQ